MSSDSSSSSSPRFSVIIPCYNHEEYIAEAIGSVLQQSEADLELIVIDDCSSDDSYARIQAFSDPRLRHRQNAVNQGAPATINAGISEARGHFVTILNSDDVFDSQRLASLAALLTGQDYDVVGSDLKLIDQHSELISAADHWWHVWFEGLKQVLRDKQSIRLALLAGNLFITTSNLLFRRELFDELGPFCDYRYTHDYDWLMRALVAGKRVHFDADHCSVAYRLHDHNTIRENPLRANQETFAILSTYLPQLFPELEDSLAIGVSHLRTIESYIEQEYDITTYHQGLHISNLEKHRDELIQHRDELIKHRDELIRHRDELIEDLHNQLQARQELAADNQRRQQHIQQLEAAQQALLNSPSMRLGRLLLSPLRFGRDALFKLGARKPRNEVHSVAELRALLKPWLDDCRLVSFDIFDTVLERRLDPPEYVHEKMAELFSHLLSSRGITQSPTALLEQRYSSERLLREEALARGEDHECHFEVLIDSWVHRVCGQEDSELSSTLKTRELQLELALLYPKPGIHDLLAELHAAGITLVASSDMYLGSEQLEHILSHSGLRRFFDAILVSSEQGVAKYSGRLFQLVLQSYHLEARQMIHIGDNIVSDVLVPARHGIHSVFLNDTASLKRRQVLRYSNRLATVSPYWRGQQAYYLALSHIDSAACDADFFYDYGATALGLLFSQFTHQLIESLATDKADRILFMARDGYLPQRLYEKFLQHPRFAHYRLAEHAYINISRKVTFAASLANGLSHQKACVALYDPEQLGLQSIFTTFSLDPAPFLELARRHGFDVIEQRLDDWDDPRLIAFLDDPLVQQQIVAQGEEAQRNLKDYLHQYGYFDCEHVALVDIGWNGTIQFALDELFATQAGPRISGYYFGYCAAIPYEFSERSAIHGVFYDERRKNPAERMVISCEEIFEEAARASEASTVGYRRVRTTGGQRIEPVLRSDESPSRIQEMAFQPQVDAMQAGVLDFADGYLQMLSICDYQAQELKPFALSLCERLLSAPTAAEVRHLSTITHADDFGRDSTMEFADIQARNRAMLRPRRFKRRLTRSHWRYAFLSGILFGSVRTLYRLLDLKRGER